MNSGNRHRLGKFVIPGILAVIWAAVAMLYYGPSNPLNPAEIDNYMTGVEKLLVANAVMPEGAGLTAEGLAGPIAELRAFAERDDGKPVFMINMMRWREGELVFPQGVSNSDVNTALDADMTYNEGLFWTLLHNYSHTAYLSHAEPNAFNYGSTADADQWGEVGIFRYRSRRDFFEMITSEDYNNILYLKLLSMGVIALVPTQVHGLMFNPMPGFPVVLGTAFIIGYLVFLLISGRRGSRN